MYYSKHKICIKISFNISFRNMEEGPNICRRLRDATKGVHDSSDKLVNLKLGVAVSEPSVWYHGLLVFSKIFFKLENCLDQCPSLGELDFEGLRRTKVRFYLFFICISNSK